MRWLAREQDAAEAEAARQRVLDLARRQRYDADPSPGSDLVPHTCHGPVLSMLVYGQGHLFRVGRC
jgi:hypothetical protein